MIPVIGILGLVAASGMGAKGAHPGDGQSQSSKHTERDKTATEKQDCGMPVLARAVPAGLKVAP